MIVDLANLEWWQAFVGILVALGLSPAPWILGLALGRIQFTGPARADFAARVADINAAHAESRADLIKHHDELDKAHADALGEMTNQRNYYRDARIVEADRATKATETSAEVAREAAKLATTALETINEGPAK